MSPLAKFRISPKKTLKVVVRNKQDILIELLELVAIMIYTATFDHILKVHVHTHECASCW